MKKRSKEVAEKMKKQVGINIRALYEQKLAEARARFALLESDKMGRDSVKQESLESPSFSQSIEKTVSRKSDLRKI